MKTLEDLPLPLLVVAPDGWLIRAHDLSYLTRWNRRSIAKYNRIGFVALDGSGELWRLQSLAWRRSATGSQRVFANLLGLALPAQAQVERVEEPPFPTLQQALLTALKADDDVITQFAEAEEIECAILSATDTTALIAALSSLRVID